MTLADFTIDSRAAEKEFVDYSRHVGLRKLKAHCFWRLGELDPEGLAIREARQRRDRFVSFTDGPDGMLTFFGKVDVVTGAPIKALLESMGSAAVRRQRHLPKDERFTPGQLMADVLSDVAKHAIGCQAVPRRPKTTVVVRMGLADVVDDLRDAGLVDELGIPTTRGRGLASCDGVLQPITPGTARLMAVEAQILPAVMGGDSLPLDLGDSKRLFTKAQTVAIVERDRGCIRCSAPPAFCHTHHVKFWSDDGPTDVSNGVLLCAGCHHRLHEQRWTLKRDGDRYVVQELDCKNTWCKNSWCKEHLVQEHDVNENAGADATRIDNRAAPTATRSFRWRSGSLPAPRKRLGARHSTLASQIAGARTLSAREDTQCARGCSISYTSRSVSWVTAV